MTLDGECEWLFCGCDSAYMVASAEGCWINTSGEVPGGVEHPHFPGRDENETVGSE